jgi:hypothetical protein
MNDITIMLLGYGMICAFAGIFTMRSISAILDYRDARRRRNEYASLDWLTDDKSCKGPHKWNQMKLAIHPLPFGKYTICTECGFISGQTDYMLNKPALEIYRNNLKRAEEREERERQFLQVNQELAEIVMNRLIKTHVLVLSDNINDNAAVLKSFFKKTVLEITSIQAQTLKDFNEKENS